MLRFFDDRLRLQQPAANGTLDALRKSGMRAVRRRFRDRGLNVRTEVACFCLPAHFLAADGAVDDFIITGRSQAGAGDLIFNHRFGCLMAVNGNGNADFNAFLGVVSKIIINQPCLDGISSFLIRRAIDPDDFSVFILVKSIHARIVLIVIHDVGKIQMLFAAEIDHKLIAIGRLCGFPVYENLQVPAVLLAVINGVLGKDLRRNGLTAQRAVLFIQAAEFRHVFPSL